MIGEFVVVIHPNVYLCERNCKLIPFGLALPYLMEQHGRFVAEKEHKSIKEVETIIQEDLDNSLANYDALLKECQENDVGKAKKHIIAADIVVAEDMEADFPLLCAAKNDNYELTKLLLENGAYSTQVAFQCRKDKPYKDFYDENNSGALSALYVASINENYDLMTMLLAYRGAKRCRKLFNEDMSCAAVHSFRIDELLNCLARKDRFSSMRMILLNIKDSDHIYPVRLNDNMQISLDDLRYILEKTDHRFEWPEKLLNRVHAEDKSLYELMKKKEAN